MVLELGFETIVYEKAPPRATIKLNRPDVLNAFDSGLSARSHAPRRTRPGTTRSGRRRHRRGACLLRRRQPALLEADASASPGTGSRSGVGGRARPVARARRADDRAHRRDRRGSSNELRMACDLSVIVDDAFIRHVRLDHRSVPPAGRRGRLQLMVGLRRRARSSVSATGSRRTGDGQVSSVVPAAAELDAVVDSGRRPRRSCRDDAVPERRAQRRRDLAWRRTSATRATGYPLSMLSDERRAGRGVPRLAREGTLRHFADEC